MDWWDAKDKSREQMNCPDFCPYKVTHEIKVFQLFLRGLYRFVHGILDQNGGQFLAWVVYSNKAIMKAEIQEVSEVIYKKIGDFLTFGTSSEFYAFSFVSLH